MKVYFFSVPFSPSDLDESKAKNSVLHEIARGHVELIMLCVLPLFCTGATIKVNVNFGAAHPDIQSDRRQALC